MSLKPTSDPVSLPAELSLDQGFRELIHKVVELTSPAKVIVLGSANSRKPVMS